MCSLNFKKYLLDERVYRYQQVLKENSRFMSLTSTLDRSTRLKQTASVRMCEPRCRNLNLVWNQVRRGGTVPSAVSARASVAVNTESGGHLKGQGSFRKTSTERHLTLRLTLICMKVPFGLTEPFCSPHRPKLRGNKILAEETSPGEWGLKSTSRRLLLVQTLRFYFLLLLLFTGHILRHPRIFLKLQQMCWYAVAFSG